MGWEMGFEPTISRTTIWRFNRLSYTHRMARQKGLEPLTYCLEGSCSIQLSYWRIFYKKMERVMGIEPTQPAWKAGILPLNYTRIGDPYENRTRVTAVKGPCLNLLTNGPNVLVIFINKEWWR